MSQIHPSLTLASVLPQCQCQLLVKPKASRPGDRGDSTRIEPLIYRPSLGNAVKPADHFAYSPVIDVEEADWVCRRSID